MVVEETLKIIKDKLSEAIYYFKNGAQNPAYNISNDDILDLLLTIDNHIDYCHEDELYESERLKFTMQSCADDLDYVESNIFSSISDLKDLKYNLQVLKKEIDDVYNDVLVTRCLEDYVDMDALNVEQHIDAIDGLISDLSDTRYKIRDIEFDLE